MNIIAVDDERLALQSVQAALKEALPDAEAIGFRSGVDAREYAKEHAVDVALLDIEMRDMNGITLAKELKLLNPNINIIFTTGYGEYVGDAMALHASGYLMKPITPEALLREFQDLRYRVTGNAEAPSANHMGNAPQADSPAKETMEAASQTVPKTRPGKKLRAQAFGSFELYHEDKPIAFKYSKSQEMIAYLIDRNGSLVTNTEVMDVLWEDDEPDQHKSYFKNLKRDIKDTLGAIDALDVLVSQWGRIGINPGLIDCDYFDWLAGTANGINAYHGEYMLQYSWAEFTNGRLDQESYKY